MGYHDMACFKRIAGAAVLGIPEKVSEGTSKDIKNTIARDRDSERLGKEQVRGWKITF